MGYFPMEKHATKVTTCKIAVISEENTLLMISANVKIKKKINVKINTNRGEEIPKLNIRSELLNHNGAL